MEILNPGRVLDVLLRELYVRGISGRELDRRLRRLGREVIRQALTERRDGRLMLDQLSSMLEASEIDAHVFLALVTGGELPLCSLVGTLASADEPIWSRYEKGILAAVKMRRMRGTASFAEVLPRLRQIEELREENQEVASTLAWEALELATEAGMPGAAAGALAALAGSSERPEAQVLFEAVLKIVGDEPPASLLAAKIYGNLGRVLLEAGYPQQAMRILRYRAYPDSLLYGGSGDDLAVLMLELFRAGRACGDIDFALSCLERAAADGGERLRFVAIHELAATLLSLDRDIERVSQLYDDLVAMPHFAAAPPVSKVRVGFSRLEAHQRTGRLASGDVPEFETAWEKNKESLATEDRVRLGLDFAEFLQRLGDHERAGKLLLSEFWPMLDLDGDATGLQARFSDACKVSKVSIGQLFEMVRR